VAFVDGFNRILSISAAVSLAGSVLALVLVRQRDFEARAAEPTPRVPGPGPERWAGRLEPSRPAASRALAAV
jgi:hypothetical protein